MCISPEGYGSIASTYFFGAPGRAPARKSSGFRPVLLPAWARWISGRTGPAWSYFAASAEKAVDSSAMRQTVGVPVRKEWRRDRSPRSGQRRTGRARRARTRHPPGKARQVRRCAGAAPADRRLRRLGEQPGQRDGAGGRPAETCSRTAISAQASAEACDGPDGAHGEGARRAAGRGGVAPLHSASTAERRAGSAANCARAASTTSCATKKARAAPPAAHKLRSAAVSVVARSLAAQPARNGRRGRPPRRPGGGGRRAASAACARRARPRPPIRARSAQRRVAARGRDRRAGHERRDAERAAPAAAAP